MQYALDSMDEDKQIAVVEHVETLAAAQLDSSKINELFKIKEEEYGKDFK